MKRILFLLLALSMLISLTACGEEEKETETAETAEETETALSDEEKAKRDEEFLATFIKDYRAGKYEEHMFFLYEDFDQFIRLSEYKGLTYPADSMVDETVTDEEVDSYLTQIYLSSEVTDDQYTKITEGVVEKYDTVNINYRGFIEGVESADASAENNNLLIGSGQFIDGFEEGLLGKAVGEEVTLDLRFSPYYHAADVAGKDVRFVVTINYIQRPTLPEFTIDVINEVYEVELTTMEEAEEAIRNALSYQKKNQVYASLATYLQNKIVSASTVTKYPERELQHYTDNYVAYYSQYLSEGQKLEEVCKDLLGVEYDVFMQDAVDHAKEQVANRLMICAIAKKENITCTDQQLESLIMGIYQNQTDGDYESLEEMVFDYMDIYGADYYEYQVLGTAVMEMVNGAAVKVDS